MEVAIVLLIITMVAVMFWSIKVSRSLSIVVFSVIFLGIAVAMIAWQGFTQQAFENLGFVALAIFIMWLRLSKSVADTARARAWLAWMDSESTAVCEMCGTRLSYQQVPKNLSFLIWRRFTCPNCGAESKVIFDTSNQENAG
jgi:transcription elongation factor Elf1